MSVGWWILQITLFQSSRGFPTRLTCRYSICCRCSTRCGSVQTCVQSSVVTSTFIGSRSGRRLFLSLLPPYVRQSCTVCRFVGVMCVNIVRDISPLWIIWRHVTSVWLTNVVIRDTYVGMKSTLWGRDEGRKIRFAKRRKTAVFVIHQNLVSFSLSATVWDVLSVPHDCFISNSICL